MEMKLAEPKFDPFFKDLFDISFINLSISDDLDRRRRAMQDIRICLATLSELPIGVCSLSDDEKTFHFGIYISWSIPFDDLKNHIRSKNAFHEFRRLNHYEMEQERNGHMQEYATYIFDNDGFIRYTNNESKHHLRSFLSDNPQIVYDILKKSINS
jgi:hypothetical protein